MAVAPGAGIAGGPASMETEVPEHEILLGRATTHLAPVGGDILLHHQLVAPFGALCALARARGIDLAVASGYRGFERQLLIWNAKARGDRAVLDDSGRAVELDRLSDKDKVFAILRWSALPGASRHHWGTDMDVWDRAAVPAQYALQLVAEEYGPGGPFARLAAWLASDEVAALGFYRPYDEDRGGVAPEPWHLSFRPVAEHFASHLTRDLLAGVIPHSGMVLGDTVLAHLDEIFARFVRCPG